MRYCCFCIIVFGIFLYIADYSAALEGDNTVSGNSKQSFTEVALPGYYLNYDNFIIYLLNIDTKYTMALYDVALEINHEESVSAKTLNIRKAIYEASQTIVAKSPRLTDLKQNLREEIRLRVNTVLNGPLVRAVYFSRFIFL